MSIQIQIIPLNAIQVVSNLVNKIGNNHPPHVKIGKQTSLENSLFSLKLESEVDSRAPTEEISIFSLSSSGC